MKLSILCKGHLEKIPPLMTVALGAAELGYAVRVITSDSEARTKSAFSARGISVVDVCPGWDRGDITSVANRVRHWRAFAKEAWRQIARDDCLLWIGGGDTALALGRRLRERSYVLHALELYDTLPVYRYLLRTYMRRAKLVVVPEMSRAAIFRVWYELPDSPVVLPNKPFHHPHNREMRVEDDTARIALSAIRPEERIVLYQGLIHPERDIRAVAEAVHLSGSGWRFVVMGTVYHDYLNALKPICPDLIWVPHVTAPQHLHVTSHAWIGILHYAFLSMNTVFCAPNKMWEYSGFGVPILCNDLPPLRFSVEAKGAGLCLPTWDCSSIAAALKEISSNYHSFSRGALQLFNSVDVVGTIQNILEMAERQVTMPSCAETVSRLLSDSIV